MFTASAVVADGGHHPVGASADDADDRHESLGARPDRGIVERNRPAVLAVHNDWLRAAPVIEDDDRLRPAVFENRNAEESVFGWRLAIRVVIVRFDAFDRDPLDAADRIRR